MLFSQTDRATDVFLCFFLAFLSVGYWSSVAGLIDGSCVSCNPGKYLNITGQTAETACLKCPRGWLQPESGQAFCLPCDAGKYANDTGTRSCKECGKGQHQDAPGTATCLGCKVGQYMSGKGAVNCLECIPGQFQDQQGNESCVQCASGRQFNASVAVGISPLNCLACGKGKHQPKQTKCHGTSLEARNDSAELRLIP